MKRAFQIYERRLLLRLGLAMSTVAGCLPWGHARPCDETAWYPDVDGDGYGTTYGPNRVLACNAPDGYVSISGDCSDGDPAMNPESPEVCGDFIDNNCDQRIDEGCEFLTVAAVTSHGRWATQPADMEMSS